MSWDTQEKWDFESSWDTSGDLRLRLTLYEADLIPDVEKLVEDINQALRAYALRTGAARERRRQNLKKDTQKPIIGVDVSFRRDRSVLGVTNVDTSSRIDPVDLVLGRAETEDSSDSDSEKT